MVRHIIIAAWRNMATNKLISAIAIFGLAVGIAAALLMAAVIRNQVSFDADLPLAERTYLAVSPPHPTLPTIWGTDSDYRTAEILMNAPGVEAVTRLTSNGATVPLKHGDVIGWDHFYWADANIFDVLRLPVLHGDLATALVRPDGAVMTRSVAEKYFGRDNAVGGVFTIAGHPMVVRAVIQDYLLNATGLEYGIFASGKAAFSDLAPRGFPFEKFNTDPTVTYSTQNRTYLRLKPSADIPVLEGIIAAYFKPRMDTTLQPFLKLVSLAGVNVFEPLNPGVRARLASAALAGTLVLLLAAINFVNLTVARSARREREVGVRKACGAGHRTLMLQFLGESLIAVLLATCIALALGEWLLPPMNGFLGTGAKFDPQLAVPLLLCILLLALAAGAYPAFLLSAFRPAAVLKGWSRSLGQGKKLRNVLVTLQFAGLIVLAISAWVIWQQRQYATHEALRIDTDQMLMLRLTPHAQLFSSEVAPLACAPALESELRKLAGVKGVGCSGPEFVEFLEVGHILSNRTNGPTWMIAHFAVSPNLLALYGVKPIAGSLDGASDTIINLAAVKKLGFSSPQAAIGRDWMPAVITGQQRTRWARRHPAITAVIPDFALYSLKKPVEAAVFSQWNAFGPGQLIHVKMNGRQIPETLDAIDKLWAGSGQYGPLDRFFLNDLVQRQYLDITRQAALLASFAGIAIVLACLGLFGIAVSTAERRTKEIGVRKAMGAGNGQIVALLLWQFAQPVLWANVIAWPVAWWLMRRWLSGFAYHIDLHWWVFAGASLGALLIALATVAGQAFLTARAKPVLALRYE